ncbi:LysE family transporter [Neobacillus drentensis]|uniref:LysE family transporter n=1 Tax=Neobacillus drentensis TaxID=220684 RepID=UPI001F340FAC|nr:LysE family transporter [Neobacillus drentensis]
MAKASSIKMPDVVQESLLKVYRHGILVEALNPKTALFFLALFPQFFNSEGGKIVM